MSSLLSTLALSSALLSAPVLGSSTPVTPDPLPEPEVAGRSWVLVSDSPSSRTPRLTLSDNGHAGGYDGCNTFGYISWNGYDGPFWTQEGNRIVFHGMAVGTQKDCLGHDEALEKADTFILDGDNLLLFQGEELLGTMIP